MDIDFSEVELRVMAWDGDYPEPEYDSGLMENVLFQVEDGQIYICGIWAMDGSNNQGLTSCENDNGCLDYMIGEQMIKNPRDGFYLMTHAEVHYSWDSYTGEGDADFYASEAMPATMPLIAEWAGEGGFRVFWTQLKLHLLYLWGYDL